MLIYVAFAVILLVPVLSHIRRTRRRETAALAAARRYEAAKEGPRAQHPHIDISHCIGCGACVEVCPEGEVLAVVAGKAAIVNGLKCIGHGLCAEACPVGAIEIVMASPSIAADLPRLTREFETNIPNLFIVGELGGLALIKNAVTQGLACVDTIAARLARPGARGPASGTVRDVCIVGAGPGGLSASLRAIQCKLSYVTFEQGDLGGTVAKYPRQKLVMTSPVEFPIYGKFKKLQLSKEELLKFWQKVNREAGLRVRSGEKVDDIQRDADGIFTVTTPRGQERARAVILALGCRGSPRELDIPGEERPKVMYSLIDAEAYTNARILVVGGGDSAVETALGLAHQRGNTVALSYRKGEFSRIKERNAKRLRECQKSGKLEVILNSMPVEVRERSVILEVQGARREIPNDFVWVLVGSLAPNDFLQRIGVQLGPHDLTAQAGAAARRTA